MDLKQAAKQMQANKGVQKLLEGEDTRRMMELLGKREHVQQAAKAAMAGDPAKLMELMKNLTSSPEGAKLVERVTEQAQKSGL